MRSTGRKDRHSKICTLKGPRDRRVRLSAHTAIQFYDVQDRLGYDRPSKAVDWLIEKAKAAIDALAELPTTATTIITSTQQPDQDLDEAQSPNHNQGHLAGSNSSGYDCQNQQHFNDNPINSLGFFSMGSTTPSPSIHFHNYTTDLNSRTISQAQDLSLSLQSFQDPILLQHHSSPIPTSTDQGLFSASTPLGFDAAPTTWSDRQTTEMGWFQRMIPRNSNTNLGNGGEGFIFNSLLPPLPQPNLSHNYLFSRRGPLQSSNSLTIRASMNPPISTNDHCPSPALDPPSTSGIEFTSQGFLGFCIPEQIQGEEEQQNTE